VDSLRDVPVLVTGAAGFIGSHLARRLVADGADVHAVTGTVSALYPVRLVDLRAGITLHQANLTDRSALDVVVARARPQVVFHLGAYTHVYRSWDRVGECIQTNVQGTVNLLQALAGPGYQRFVNVGTSEIYGGVAVPFREDGEVQPLSPYAVTKAAAERCCAIFQRRHGWPIVMVRPFNAFGPQQTPDRVIPEIVCRALRGQELLMTRGQQTREFNFVEDIADGLVRAGLADGVDGEIVNLGCGEEIAIADLAVTVLGLLGDPIVPRLGALPDRDNEIWRMCCDNGKARSLLGWSPAHDLRAGLERTIEWYRAEIDRPGSPFVT
jgi:UDP-glucose 4-epimerase